MSSIPVTRLPLRLAPDARRLITKPFLSVDDVPAEGKTRVEQLIGRILDLSHDEVEATLDELRRNFQQRHADLDAVFERGFLAVAQSVPDAADLPDDMRRLVGAYFMHEYSLEGAALTNPSIVAHPDQTGVPDARFGSSSVFDRSAKATSPRSSSERGVVGPGGDIEVEPPGVPMTGHRQSPTFDKPLFTAKLAEMGATDDLALRTLSSLEDQFTMADLDGALADLARHEAASNAVQHVTQVMHWLASSNYKVAFPPESELSQRVLFPNGPSESRGMEDARLVRFVERRRLGRLLRAVHGIRRLQHPPPTHPDDRLQDLPDRHAQRTGRRQQGHRHLPPPHRRTVCRSWQIRRREQLPDAVRSHPLLARG